MASEVPQEQVEQTVEQQQQGQEQQHPPVYGGPAPGLTVQGGELPPPPPMDPTLYQPEQPDLKKKSKKSCAGSTCSPCCGPSTKKGELPPDVQSRAFGAGGEPLTSTGGPLMSTSRLLSSSRKVIETAGPKGYTQSGEFKLSKAGMEILGLV
ncbi:unnamed protein product [Vitrella brassicaformis CCMP3155]|uniref:Uncharacterized protein n=1 Tax=Vitrella brassicaformis (strain CCMP3155) TaxID=1169540 RepID=A0A0G4EM90_VITBC|nr:unnamed protein product [Vitrella brassicaformis CCMP3155]|mmetsp:Transcript_10432/g.25243  ORF Transcript_10432/g.25243 Transcript_10432/m.25243 type:complete len:152 (-) Transcript_10432:459-914(-)|eukprot:CEL98100.1 unnamed protein product [Vitrella brassicaformis CCMP3155]